MQGFLRRRIPLTLRRAITMAPALLVLAAPALSVDPYRPEPVELELVAPVPAGARAAAGSTNAS